MTDLSPIDQVREQRDKYKARCQQLESELEKTKMLLDYARQAAEAEYQLRMKANTPNGKCAQVSTPIRDPGCSCGRHSMRFCVTQWAYCGRQTVSISRRWRAKFAEADSRSSSALQQQQEEI